MNLHAVEGSAAAERGGATTRTPVLDRTSTGRRVTLSWWGAIGWIVMLLLWELATAVGLVDPSISSSPTRIATAEVQLFQDGSISSALASTASLIASGMGISLLVGVPLGLLIGASRRLHLMTAPLIDILYSVPFVLFLPVIIYWFGLGFTSKTVLVVWAAILPLMINVITGIRNLDTDYTRVTRLFCCSKTRFLFSVAYPATLPYILSGIRQALGRALVGAVVAEFFLGGSGIGAFVQLQTSNFNMDNAMAAIALLAIVAVLLNKGVGFLESRYTHWSGAE